MADGASTDTLRDDEREWEQWKAMVDVMTDALIAQRWQPYDPSMGGTPETYQECIDGDRAALWEDMSEGLAALGAAGWQIIRGDERGAAEVCSAVLADLVALKDGPRDGQYEHRKPFAWNEARDAVAVWRRRGTPGRTDHDNEGAGTT